MKHRQLQQSGLHRLNHDLQAHLTLCLHRLAVFLSAQTEVLFSGSVSTPECHFHCEALSPSWQNPSFPAWNPICKLHSFSTVSERLGLNSPVTISEPCIWLCFITLKFLVAVGASLQRRRLLFLGCVSFCFPWKIRAHSSLISMTVSQTPAIPLLSSLLFLPDTT